VYELEPARIFATHRVFDDPRYVERMERMLPHMGGLEPVRVTDDELVECIKSENWSRRRMGHFHPPQDPSVVFSTWRWSGEDLGIINRDGDRGIFSYDAEQEAEALAMAKRHGYPRAGEFMRHLIGQGPFEFTHEPGCAHVKNRICRPAIEVHTMDGCPHKCVYCGFGKVMVVMLNVEELVERVARCCELNPWQKVYRYDINGEALALEPEFGATQAFVDFFATTEDYYFLIHSKSSNVDHLLDLDHKGHTIMLWSLTSETATSELEKDSAPTFEIIEAAGRCQKAGYPVRIKFKPIIPVVNWRQEAVDMIRRAFECTQPDMFTLCTLGWTSLEELKQIIPSELLDPDCLQAAEDGFEEMKDLTQKPFPHELRKEIYRFYFNEIRKYDADVPVSLSTETWEMWRDVKDEFGEGPLSYVCGCGPQAVPHAKRISVNPYKVAQLRAS